MVFGSKDKSETVRRRVPPSFVGGGARIEGDVNSEGQVDIAGSVTGNVTAGKLTVFEGATIKGTVRAETAVVNGTLNGRLTAKEIALGSASNVTADLVYVSLRIDAGAVFVGQTRRVESLDAVPPDLKLPPPIPTPAKAETRSEE